MVFHFDISVDAKGPVFDGRWVGIMYRYKQAVLDKLSDTSVHRIKEYLPTQYMYLGHNGGNPRDNPVPPDAGYLVSTIHQRRETEDSHLVLDGGYPQVIYGPWIEGIGPGNFYIWPGRIRRGLSPRFPGYHAFQKTAHEVQMVASDLAEEVLPPYLAALNE
jgi:hypothetical protein